MDATSSKSDWKADLVERLHNPLQLRLFLAGLMLVAGYLGVYWPLSAGIDDTSRELAIEQRRLDLARDIEKLRDAHETFKRRLPQTPQAEWMHYLNEASKRFPVFRKVEFEEIREFGPYKVVVLRVELQGRFEETNQFLNWLETNKRLIRVDEIKMSPHRSQEGQLETILRVLGLGVVT